MTNRTEQSQIASFRRLPFWFIPKTQNGDSLSHQQALQGSKTQKKYIPVEGGFNGDGVTRVLFWIRTPDVMNNNGIFDWALW